MSYWTFSDVFEEGGVVKTPFYGGFGIVAEHDIPKPAFNAFALLHRLGDLAREPVGRAVPRFHQRYVKGAQLDWCSRLGDDHAVFGNAVAAADVGRRFAADQQCASTVGDHRGVQHVVEMRVDRDDRF